ncbi:MAG: hypothetical protein ABSA93_34790 [Streptosporangiaceae bacterium]|jgi:hypothetical protein
MGRSLIWFLAAYAFVLDDVSPKAYNVLVSQEAVFPIDSGLSASVITAVISKLGA